MNAQPASVVPYVRRITPKVIAELQGINLLQLQRPVEACHLYDLVGTIFGSKVKQDKTGTRNDSVAFAGEFQACNIDTGEVYAESGIAFIPVMESVLHTAMQNALEKDPKARIVAAFRVSIKPAPADKPSMTGYEWDVQRLIPHDRQPEDPITRLKAMAKEYRAALPAPTPKVEEEKSVEAPAPTHSKRK